MQTGARNSNPGGCCLLATSFWDSSALRSRSSTLSSQGGQSNEEDFLASLASLALASGSALAADLPAPAYKAPPPPPPSYSWTGCYINAGWGYGMWNQDHYAETSPPLTAALVPVSQSTTDGGRGWLGTVGGGCDFQASRWVLGAFADYDFMNLKGTSSPDLTATVTPFFVLRGDEKDSGAWSVGARLGYLVTPSLLTYVNGGYTQTRFDQVNYTTNFVVPTPATGVFLPAHTYNGWFIGGGTEYALNMDWLPIHGLFLRRSIATRATRAPISLSFAPAAAPHAGRPALSASASTPRSRFRRSRPPWCGASTPGARSRPVTDRRLVI